MSMEKQPGPVSGGAQPDLPVGETARASQLAPFGFEALEADPELSAIARFAGELCGVPTALVSIIESDRQRFIARMGFDGPEPAPELSFCAHSMLGDSVMEVCDAALHAAFADNALVTGPPHIRFYAGAPLRTPEGTPLGALCVIDTVPRPAGLTALQRSGLQVLAQAVMRRLTATRAGRMASVEAAESARTMREIADLLPAIVWSADGEGRFDYYNGRWNEITGLPRPKKADDWRGVVHPEDAGSTVVAWTQSFADGRPFESEFRLKQADGTWRWMMSRALPFHVTEGAVGRWYGTLTDIDDSHRRSDNRDLLARELSHRIKNIFAVVAGLVSLRARRRPEAADFADELNGAIRALGRAHDFVRPLEGVKGNSLVSLLTELMAPYADGSGRIAITGKDCVIGVRAATPLALTFHELATNAAKYGSLSVEGGSVTIEMDDVEDAALARITWRVWGGPAAHLGEEGFGSRLVKSAIEGQLGGRIERRFASGGLEVDLEIPLAAIRS